MERIRSRHAAVIVLSMLLTAVVSAETDLRLIEAIKNQDARAAAALLELKVDVNARQPDGATALHWAAYWDDSSTADLLIRAGAVVNATNDYGVTPLSLSCTNGSAAMVRRLMAAGADSNSTLPNGETALMTAAYSGNAAVVSTLLAHGAAVNATEPSGGQTALMWAVAEKHVGVAQILLEHGANVHARSAAGYTPLLFAAREGDFDAVRLFLAAGASLNEAATDGVAPLLMATVRGHVDLAKFLLGQGADANAESAGYTALHWAAGTWETPLTQNYVLDDTEWSAIGGLSVPGKEDLITALLVHGADVNARMKRNPPRLGSGLGGLGLGGATPFLVAAMSADTQVMRLLLEHGADPQLTTTANVTPLMAAAGLDRNGGSTLITEQRSIDAVTLALELGNDINAVDNRGETALHATAYAGTDAIATFLVEKGADLNPRNKNGQTPLGVAEGYVFATTLLTRPSTAAVLRKFGATDLGTPAHTPELKTP